MGLSTHVEGIKPADEKYKRMSEAYFACEKAGVDVPDEVEKFFNGERPDPKGVVIDLLRNGTSYRSLAHGVAKYSDDESDGFEIDLRLLDKDIKILRFYQSC